MNTITRITVSPTFGDVELPSLVKQKVTHLSVRECRKVTDASIPVILSLVYLKEVNISGSGISMEGLEMLCRNENLQVIFVDRSITLIEKATSPKPW